MEKFSLVINEAKKHNLLIRGYISCVMGCPYEGEISPEKVIFLIKKLYFFILKFSKKKGPRSSKKNV